MKTTIIILLLPLAFTGIFAQSTTDKAFLDAIASGNIQKVDMYFSLGYNSNSSYQRSDWHFCNNKIHDNDLKSFPFFLDCILDLPK